MIDYRLDENKLLIRLDEKKLLISLVEKKLLIIIFLDEYVYLSYQPQTYRYNKAF